MAIITLQQSDPATGAFDSADRYTCVITVPFVHKLRSAKIGFFKSITTGAVTVSLRQSDIGDGKAGALVGTTLVNADLNDIADIWTKLDFVLGADDKLTSPANRKYFLQMAASNAADRIDGADLILEVDKA